MLKEILISQGMIALVYAALLFIFKILFERFVDNKFKKQNDLFISELDKVNIKLKAQFGYKEYVTLESFKATLDLYSDLLEAQKAYNKLLNKELEKQERDIYWNVLHNFNLELRKKMILLNSKVFKEFQFLKKSMFKILLQIEMKSSIKQIALDNELIIKMDERFRELPNLIREELNLEKIPEEIINKLEGFEKIS